MHSIVYNPIKYFLSSRHAFYFLLFFHFLGQVEHTISFIQSNFIEYPELYIKISVTKGRREFTDMFI